MEEKWIRSLIREDPTCHWGAKPLRHSSWAPRALGPWSPRCTTGETHTQQLESNPCSPHQRKAHTQQQRPSTAKIIHIKKNTPTNKVVSTTPCKVLNLAHGDAVVSSLSHVWLLVTPWTAVHQVPCPSPSPRVCSNLSPLSQWCHPTISSSVVPFSSCLQSFPASGWGSFPICQLFASNGQSIGASASAAVLPMNIQDWFPLGLKGLISLLSKGC